MPPAARITDLHVCPLFSPTPHVGGPLITGKMNVIIGKMPASRVLDKLICKGPPDLVLKGSPTVLIGKLPAARMLDPTVHGGLIVTGYFTVIIGEFGMGQVVGPVAPVIAGLKLAAELGSPFAPAGDAVTAAATAGAIAGAGAGAALTPEQRETQQMLSDIENGKSKLSITGTPEYKAKTMDALKRLASTPTGNKLIKALANSPFTTVIGDVAKPGDGNSENAAVFKDGLWDTANNKKGPGTNTTVDWSPTREKIDGEDWMTRDPAIGLGHELVHAYYDVTGTTDGRKEVEYKDQTGATRKAPGWELQGAGLGPYANADLSENKLRSEFTASISSLGRAEPQRPRY